jgi:hypothetical protein
MQGPSIDDQIQSGKLPDDTHPGALDYPNPEVIETGRRIDLGFLKAPTGEGSIESYMDHPMNFNRSKSLAQIIRGMTGMLGELNLAIFDVVIGAFNYVKERKPNGPVNPV